MMELLCPFAFLLVAFVTLSRADLLTDAAMVPELRLFHHSCALKKDEGPCKALVDRFYFNVETGHCERFEYGGCQGNANNFETLEMCEDACLVKPDKSPCHLKEEVGPCRGLVLRYHYSTATRRCERFFYGGCHGNANNFQTLEQCQARCHGKDKEGREIPGTRNAGQDGSTQPLGSTVSPPEKTLPTKLRYPRPSGDTVSPTCLPPVFKGTCTGSFKRYAYNPKTKRCQSFRYTGCGGNSNNFESKKDCVKACFKDLNSKKIIIQRV